MPKKQFDCNSCVGVNISDNNQGDKSANPKDVNDTNALIINELKSLSSRMTAMENKVAGGSPHRTHSSTKSRTDNDSNEGELIFPPLPALKQSKSMQQQVDDRIRQLAKINEQGKLRSQRGGVDNVWVKMEVPWPQNHILGASNKTRVPYDSLSMSQSVAGFAQINR